MMIHVGGALLNPILSALPKNSNQITYEDPVVDDSLPRVSLYDDMNAMLTGKTHVYAVARQRKRMIFPFLCNFFGLSINDRCSYQYICYLIFL